MQGMFNSFIDTVQLPDSDQSTVKMTRVSHFLWWNCMTFVFTLICYLFLCYRHCGSLLWQCWLVWKWRMPSWVWNVFNSAMRLSAVNTVKDRQCVAPNGVSTIVRRYAVSCGKWSLKTEGFTSKMFPLHLCSIFLLLCHVLQWMLPSWRKSPWCMLLQIRCCAKCTAKIWCDCKYPI